LALAIALWCSVSDLFHRRISNKAVLLLVAVAVVLSCATGVWIDWISLFVAILIGLAVYLLRCFGAGDVKFFWACMLVVPNQVDVLLFSTAFAGLVLAIVYLAKHRFRPKEVGTLPYGVAISTGLVLCVLRAVM
jgi:Flp pilus assembly protein protease CpaA